MLNDHAALVNIVLLDRDFNKYRFLYLLECSINYRFLINKFKCVFQPLSYFFPIMSSLLKLHRCIPASGCHFQSVNEMMDPFLRWVFCKCGATVIYVLARV